jgi:transposase
MPQISQVLRECAIGMLTAVMSTRAVARELNVHFSTISCLQCRFRSFGSMSNRLHNRRPRVTTPAEDLRIRYIFVKSVYITVLWLGGRSCSWSCWLQTWCISATCRAVAERTAYELGGWVSTLGEYPLLTGCVWTALGEVNCISIPSTYLHLLTPLCSLWIIRLWQAHVMPAGHLQVGLLCPLNKKQWHQ